MSTPLAAHRTPNPHRLPIHSQRNLKFFSDDHHVLSERWDTFSDKSPKFLREVCVGVQICARPRPGPGTGETRRRPARSKPGGTFEGTPTRQHQGREQQGGNSINV